MFEDDEDAIANSLRLWDSMEKKPGSSMSIRAYLLYYLRKP